MTVVVVVLDPPPDLDLEPEEVEELEDVEETFEVPE